MKRIRRNERGSALIIALAFLLLFSLWLSATLAATETGLTIQHTMRVQPKRLYAADGAIEQAIQAMRYDASQGTWDDPDCDMSTTLQNPAQTVYVRCEPAADSGLGEAGESSPPIGIIGLSDGAGGEFAYQQYGNSVVRIDGGVFSNTPMLFQNGNDCQQQPQCQQLNLCPRNSRTVNDGVVVRGTPTVTSLSAGFVAADVGVPIIGNGIPTGTTIASVIGATSVNMSKNALSSGVNRVIRIREDYPKLQSHCRERLTAEGLPDFEEMKKGKATAVPRPGDPNYPESCDQARIVSLWFNCDSAYVADPDGIDKNYPPDKTSGFANQNVPPCGTTNRIVELNPGRYANATELTALTTGCDKLLWFKPGTYYFDFPNANPVWTIGASNLPNLTVVGGDKTWDRDPFRATVTYRSQNNTSTVSVCATCPPPFKLLDANGAYINAGYNLPYKTVIRTVSVDRRSATFTGPPLTMNFDGYFSVSPITSTLNPLGSLCDPRTHVDHTGTEFIFGGQSRVVLTDGKTELCSPVSVTDSRQQIAIYGVKTNQAQLRAQDGCITAQPYSPGGGNVCPMILAPQGSKPAFIVHGTIYAPKAAIDLSLQGVGYQVVTRGIIARVVALAISPSSLFSDALIFSPNFDSVPGAPRKMTLTACIGGVCPPDGSGKPKIRAFVRIEDHDEFENPGVPGHKVFIDSWSVL